MTALFSKVFELEQFQTNSKMLRQLDDEPNEKTDVHLLLTNENQTFEETEFSEFIQRCTDIIWKISEIFPNLVISQMVHTIKIFFFILFFFLNEFPQKKKIKKVNGLEANFQNLTKKINEFVTYLKSSIADITSLKIPPEIREPSKDLIVIINTFGSFPSYLVQINLFELGKSGFNDCAKLSIEFTFPPNPEKRLSRILLVSSAPT